MSNMIFKKVNGTRVSYQCYYSFYGEKKRVARIDAPISINDQAFISGYKIQFVNPCVTNADVIAMITNKVKKLAKEVYDKTYR